MAFRSIRNPIASSTVTVAVFWWLMLTLVEIDRHGFSLEMIADMKLTMAFWGVGAVFGIAYVAYEIWNFRKRQIEGLAEGNIRGLFSSLGPPPVLTPPPLQAKLYPATLPYPPDLTPEFLDEWYRQYTQTHPAHVAMMRALVRTFAHRPKLPATHVPGGHGGRTLLQHSLLVCGLCLRLANSWKYEGLKGKSGRTIVPLRDPSYTFNPDDPMVALVGFAHDIGKIECYVMDDAGKVVGSRYEHDQVGGRMLGRMEAIWDLPDEDRRLLISVASFYHRPMDLPFANGGIPIDDRIIALMELLIKADTIASRLENGQSEEESQQCDKETPSDEKERLWTGFKELMLQSGRINGPSASFRLGQKNDDETGQALVYLHEASLRGALAKHLGISEGHQLGDKTYPLTRALLKTLEEKEVLYQSHGDAAFSDSRSIFNVEFYSKKEERLATWPATIIIRPGTILPALANLPDFTSFPKIGRALFGRQSAKNKRKSLMEAAEEAEESGNEESLMQVQPIPVEEPSRPVVALRPQIAEPVVERPPLVLVASPPDDDIPSTEPDDPEGVGANAEEEECEEYGESIEGEEAEQISPTLEEPGPEVANSTHAILTVSRMIRAQVNAGIMKNSQLPDGRLVVRLEDVISSNSKWANIEAEIKAATEDPPLIEVVDKHDKKFLLVR